jgi:hypothetical protein
MRQAGQSKKMAEAWLSFEERKTITILIQFFPFLKCVYIFLAHSLYIYIHIYIYIYIKLVFYVEVLKWTRDS